MKKFLHKVGMMTAAGVALSVSAANAGHLSDELLISGKLTGDQEVPSVSTTANGVASLFLNSTWDTLFVNVSAANLSGPITGIHVHEGAEGANGGVVTNLTPFVNGNQVKAALTGTDLTKEMISKYLSGKYYLNLHTAANPNGEVRAQLALETDWAFRAKLDTAQQNHTVSNNASALAYFNLSHDKKSLEVKLAADGLSGAITGTHLHFGKKGADGGVAVNLTSLINGSTVAGDVDVSTVPGLADSLVAGNVYVNLHTANNAAGELRGQLWLDNRLAFDSWLNTTQQVTAPNGASGSGASYVSLNTTLDTLWYDVQVQGLTGAISAAHIHEAAVGVDGGVLADLSADVSGNVISGMLTGAAVTTNLVSKLLSGDTYINIHTAANAGGEIRGQIYRLAREGYTISLEGNQEVPSIFAIAKGSGLVSVDRNQTNAHYMMVANGLSGAITGAHFHNGAIGVNGGVLYDLSTDFSKLTSEDGAFGYWKSTDALTPFTTSSSTEFRADNVYVNIHTALNAAGELRGQVLRGAVNHAHQTISNGTAAVDPQFAGGILFTAKFTGDQLVPAVTTTANGVGGFLLNDTRDTLFVNINIDGLSGAITAAHVHEGVKGVSGGVVADLSSMINETEIAGFLTGFDLQKYIEGAYYVNIHTAANPNGEVRGQIGFETDWMFQANLTGAQEVPAVSTTATGKGVFNLSQDESELEIKVVVNGLSGAITGAHLHNAATGATGGVVANLTANVKDNYIVATVDPSTFLAELKAGNIYLNIHTAANANGEVRGQLTLSNAFTFDAWLNGAQESPEATTPGVGVASFWFNATWDTLHYDMQFDHLSGPISAIHVHNALVNANGGVDVDLMSGVNGNVVKGSITGAALTNTLVTRLMSGASYINVHTAAFANGEVRGQVFRLPASGYSFDMCGGQQSPAVTTNAYGGGVLSVNRGNDKAHLMFTTANLSGAITGVHLHEASKGANGGVVSDVAGSLSGNSGFSYVAIDSATATKIKSGDIYLNVHTAANTNGEVRGQIDNTDDCPTPSISTATEAISNTISLSIYPNPVNDRLNINVKSQGSVTVTVVDVFGKEVFANQFSSTPGKVTVDMQNAVSGIYFVKVISNGDEVSKKVLKI